VLLVTDSSACLPPGLLGRAHLRVVPLSVLLPDAELPDGPAASERVYRAFAAGEPTKSAPPSLREYLDALEGDAYDEAVILTPAVEFTVMYRNARLAATMARRHVEVVDTRTAAAGQGLIVSVAVEALEAGASASEVAEIAREAAHRTDLVAMLPDLASIERSGHVPATALHATGGTATQPIFRFSEGSVVPLGGQGTQADATSILRTTWAAAGGLEADRTLFFHAASYAEALRFRTNLGHDQPIVEFSPAMTVHTGIGCVGVAWMRAP
jgi:DegV family protein with EDD domain